MTGGHLARRLRIGDELTRHTHGVAVALRDHLVAHVQRVDARAGEHGFVRDGLHLLGQVDELAFGHDLVRHGARGLMEAGLHRPGVHAVLLDDGDELEGVLDAVAVRHEVVGGDAHEHRGVRADAMHFVEDLGEQTGAVLGASTVLVGAMVRVFGQKAHDHVADARVDLDDVEAGFDGAARGLSVLLHHDGDFFLGVLALGHAHERAARHVLRRGVGLQLVVARRAPLVAQLQLHGRLGAVLVAHLVDARETGDKRIIPNASGSCSGMVLWRRIEAIAHVGAAQLQKARTAFGTLLEEVDDGVGDVVVIDHLGGHRQHDEPVSDLDPADAERLQQPLVLCHDANPFPLGQCEAPLCAIGTRSIHANHPPRRARLPRCTHCRPQKSSIRWTELSYWIVLDKNVTQKYY